MSSISGTTAKSSWSTAKSSESSENMSSLYKPPALLRSTNNRKGASDANSRNQGDALKNQRFMANIQATLLNGSSRPRSVRQRRSKQPVKEELFFDSITGAVERIRLADTDLTASLSDVRPYLLQNTAYFSEDELQELCSVFCESAIQQTNAYYIVGLCTDLIGIVRFGEQMSHQLGQLTGKFLSDSSEEAENCKSLPEFLAQLAIENSNMILFCVVNTVMGWIQFISQKAEEDLNRTCEATDNKEEDKRKQEPEEANPLMLKCAQALCSFCMIGQRSIWLNFPDIFDGVFCCTKNLLISNIPMKRTLKSSLLQLHVLLNKWSMSNVPKFNTTTTQTICKVD